MQDKTKDFYTIVKSIDNSALKVSIELKRRKFGVKALELVNCVCIFNEIFSEKTIFVEISKEKQ